MSLADVIVLAVLAAVVAGAVWYLVRAKKRGVKCIGCPSGCGCHKKGGCGGCGHSHE